MLSLDGTSPELIWPGVSIAGLVSPGLTQAEVDERVDARVPAVYRTGDVTTIPTAKLPASTASVRGTALGGTSDIAGSTDSDTVLRVWSRDMLKTAAETDIGAGRLLQTAKDTSTSDVVGTVAGVKVLEIENFTVAGSGSNTVHLHGVLFIKEVDASADFTIIAYRGSNEVANSGPLVGPVTNLSLIHI